MNLKACSHESTKGRTRAAWRSSRIFATEAFGSYTPPCHCFSQTLSVTVPIVLHSKPPMPPPVGPSPPLRLLLDGSKTVSWGYYNLAAPPAAYVHSGSTIKVEVATHQAGADYTKFIKVTEHLPMLLPELTPSNAIRVRCLCHVKTNTDRTPSNGV